MSGQGMISEMPVVRFCRWWRQFGRDSSSQTGASNHAAWTQRLRVVRDDRYLRRARARGAGHCEECKRRSNPDLLGSSIDCFRLLSSPFELRRTGPRDPFVRTRWRCAPKRNSPVKSSWFYLSRYVCKNISLPVRPKSLLELPPSCPSRGAYRDRHGRGVGCGGRRRCCWREHELCGRPSRVVLTPRRRRQVCGAIRRRRWQESPIAGESTKEAVKTIACGNAGLFRWTCGDYSCAFYLCTRGCGCIVRPAFPAPSVGRTIYARLGRIAQRERGCLLEFWRLVIASQRVARIRARWQAPRSNPALAPQRRKLDCFVASLLAM